jgi:hypothetical protein
MKRGNYGMFKNTLCKTNEKKAITVFFVMLPIRLVVLFLLCSMRSLTSSGFAMSNLGLVYVSIPFLMSILRVRKN